MLRYFNRHARCVCRVPTWCGLAALILAPDRPDARAGVLDLRVTEIDPHGEAEVLAFDGGEILVVWRSNENLNQNLGSHSDLLFTRIVIASDSAAVRWVIYE